MSRRHEHPHPPAHRGRHEPRGQHEHGHRGGSHEVAWAGEHDDQSPSLDPDYSGRYRTPARGAFEPAGGYPSRNREFERWRGPRSQHAREDEPDERPQWRTQSYNEYEPENRLPQMGGGGNAYPRFHGGGRYTSAGYGSGMSDDPSREFGSSYGSASGYGGQPPRRGSEHEGAGYAGSMYGTGSGATREPGAHRSFAHDHERSYVRGAGGGAGEHGGSGPSHEPGERDFRGHGPKGYTRSDERLQEDICERLTDDPHVDATDIDISVREGVVTLSGSVSDRWMKFRAEDLVDRCPGVRDIENRLQVDRAGKSVVNRPSGAQRGDH